MHGKNALAALALTLIAGCTQVAEYTGELECAATDLDAWLLMETAVGSPEPEGWFGASATDARDTWVAVPIEDAELDGPELTFEADFGNNGVWDVVLDATDDGGWEGEIDTGAEDCDLTLDLET